MTERPELIRDLPALKKVAYENFAQAARSLRGLAELAEACADPGISTKALFRRPEVADLELEYEPSALGPAGELLEAIEARWSLLDAATDEASELLRATRQSLDVLGQILAEALGSAQRHDHDCDCDH